MFSTLHISSSLGLATLPQFLPSFPHPRLHRAVHTANHQPRPSTTQSGVSVESLAAEDHFVDNDFAILSGEERQRLLQDSPGRCCFHAVVSLFG